MSTRDGKILPLESLRGLAALSVVIYHSGGTSILFDNAFFRHAYLMVDFFFVLSGYVIALNYFDRINGIASLVAFQTKRFWRLYPLHLATLLCYLGIETAKYVFEQKTGIVANNPAFSINDGWAFVANLLLAHAFLVPEPSFNIPSWSISAEFYTYLIFAVVLLARRRAVLVVAVAALMFLVAIGFNGGKVAEDFSFTMARCVLAFFTGACIHLSLRRWTIELPALAQPLSLLAAGAAIVLLAGTSGEWLLPLLFALVVLAFSSGGERPVARVLSAAPLVYLGTISYSIYMTHSIVWWASDQFMRFVLHLPTRVTESGAVVLAHPQGADILIVGLQLALTIAVSHLTYVLIEKRFRHGIPGRARPHAPTAPGKA